MKLLGNLKWKVPVTILLGLLLAVLDGAIPLPYLPK